MDEMDLDRLQAEIRRVMISVTAGLVTLTALVWWGALMGWLW